MYVIILVLPVSYNQIPWYTRLEDENSEPVYVECLFQEDESDETGLAQAC